MSSFARHKVDVPGSNPSAPTLMSKIGIIGWGTVGQATGKGFARRHKVLWYDKYKNSPVSFPKLIKESEFIFVCVPTPMFSDYSGLDLSIVESVVDTVASKIAGSRKVLIIKSTVLPGTTATYTKKYPKVIFAMNPEFLREKYAKKDFLFPSRTVIGTLDRKTALRIKRLYQAILPKNQPYFLTDPTSAELAKYMSNVMLASKVLLANEFCALARALGVDYDTIQKMVEADPRIGSHLKVPGPDGDLGFGGKCFPKDLVGILSLGEKLGVDLSALRAIWKKNLKIRRVYDWKEIPGVINRKKRA